MKRPLTVVVIALGAWLYFQLRQPAPPAVPQPGIAAGAPQADSPPRQQLEESQDAKEAAPRASPADYPAMVERPLFMESRRPAEKSRRAAVRASGSPEEELRLTAIAISERGRYALVRKGREGQTIRLKEGSEVEGWTLIEVRAAEVSLRRGEELRTLPLLREVAEETDEELSPEEAIEAASGAHDRGGESDAAGETADASPPGLPDEVVDGTAQAESRERESARPDANPPADSPPADEETAAGGGASVAE
ncbi:MAG: hypothetical protein R3F45_01770 [Gammaproteobacteria bacterium]